MKNKLNEYILEHQQETYDLGWQLFTHPELGFKEFETKKIILDYLKKHNLHIDKEYAITGFSVTIGKGKPHIGLIAETDAIPTINHPYASKKDNAAHSCGHSTQVAICLAALSSLNQIIDQLEGSITLFFTPAEEFTDINYRENLIKEGKIKYLSGKENMLADKLFDDIDVIIHLHGSGEYKDHHFSIGSVLSGFTYKRIIFQGKAAHAAVNPSQGINALNMCTLFLNAVNMLRETFKEEDLVRFHGMIEKGGTTVNSIPEEVIYQCYCRSSNPDYLLKLSKQINKTAKCCAEALNGQVTIEEHPGYFPLTPSAKLSEVVYKNMLNFYDEKEIKHNEKSCAAGDVGDISLFKPIIQYGYTGFKGNMHGSNLEIADPYEVYMIQAQLVADSIYDLLADKNKVKEIIDDFKPSMTYQQYIDYLNKH